MKAEKIQTKIGMWMDHSVAKIIHPNGTIEIIKADNLAHKKIAGESGNGTRLGNFRSSNNEAHMHNKEINDIHHYFNHLIETIKSYDEVYVFGPTTAATEFQNYVIDKHKSISGKIAVSKTDYMTDHQLVAYVNDLISLKNA